MKGMAVRDQRGVALVIALVLLLVLTLLGISSMSSTFFETKISGDERFGNAAFYASRGGVEVGIRRLPNVAAYSGSTGSDQAYRSGRMIDATPKPSVDLGPMVRPGFETTWEFRRFQVNAVGESFAATRETEVQVSYGPSPAGTQYN
jgi:Tfp pilus assembly protein PilX